MHANHLIATNQLPPHVLAPGALIEFMVAFVMN